MIKFEIHFSSQVGCPTEFRKTSNTGHLVFKNQFVVFRTHPCGLSSLSNAKFWFLSTWDWPIGWRPKQTYPLVVFLLDWAGGSVSRRNVIRAPSSFASHNASKSWISWKKIEYTCWISSMAHSLSVKKIKCNFSFDFDWSCHLKQDVNILAKNSSTSRYQVPWLQVSRVGRNSCELQMSLSWF